MSNDRPDPLDHIIAQSRQQGDPPAELNDPRDYLVFDRLSSAGALDDDATVVTKGRDGRLAVSDPDTVLGVVVGAVDPVTPEALESERVSAMPTLAPGVERPRLARRNGTPVR